MKKAKMILAMFVLSTLLCSCANEASPADAGVGSNAAEPQATVHISEQAPAAERDVPEANPEEDVLSQIKASVGIPFRLWNSQNQELHCISFSESSAKREVERKTEPAHEEQSDLSWSITGNVLSVAGAWNEDFVVDAAANSATSLSDGMVYDIVSGNMIDGHYTG